jgi:hypothetical protein
VLSARTATTVASDSEQRFIESLIYALGVMAAHVEVDLAEDEREAFYEAVLADLDSSTARLGEQLRSYLHEVRTGLEEQGIFKRLREYNDPDT